MLTPTELQASVVFIREAVDRQVFEPVDMYRHHPKGDPAIIIACGDMDQIEDRLTHCWHRLTKQSQLVGMQGGGLLLDALSVVNHEFNSVPAVIHQINLAIKAKEIASGKRIKRIIPYIDFPCGVAAEYHLTAAMSCQSAINGKRYLKEVYPDREIALKFYLGDVQNILGEHHRLVLEHPQATGLTFRFSSKVMESFLREFSPSEAMAG